MTATSAERTRRAILVGDVHATPSELRDCQALITGLMTMKEYADTVVFLGDQFHTHAILHLDVVDFWVKAIRGLQSIGFKVVMLVGNHDIETCGQLHPNALETLYGTGVTVVDKPMTVGLPNAVFMPYIHDGDEFVRLANENASPSFPILVCHQTFQGAQYDNGFYANDGVEQDRLNFDSLISGHIHSQAVFGKVWYVGSPRWRGRDDANKAKNVVVFDFETQDTVAARSTSLWCQPIVSFDLTPESEPVPVADVAQTARVTVTLRGPADWVRTEGDRYKAMGYAVRRLPDVNVAPRVRESAPVNESFMKFISDFQTPNGTPADTLRHMVAQCLSM